MEGKRKDKGVVEAEVGGRSFGCARFCDFCLRLGPKEPT